MYVYYWVTLIYSRNEYNIVNKLYFNKNKFKKFLFWPFKLFLTALLTQNSLPVPTTFLISNCQQYILNYFFILIWVGKKILYFHHSDWLNAK